MKPGSIFWVLIAVLAGVSTLIVIDRSWSKSYDFQGAEFDPPLAVDDFRLTDQQDGVYQLSEHRGKVILIFFGYTNCPDICPTTLAGLKQVRDGLGSRAENVEFVFLTLDPDRDTPSRLAQYLPNFAQDITGLTGSLEELAPVWDSFGAYRQISSGDSASGYLLDHTTRLYGIDPEGKLRVTYQFGTEPISIIKDVIYLLGLN